MRPHGYQIGGSKAGGLQTDGRPMLGKMRLSAKIPHINGVTWLAAKMMHGHWFTAANAWTRAIRTL